MYKARCITMVIRAKRENPNEKEKKKFCAGQTTSKNKNEKLKKTIQIFASA